MATQHTMWAEYVDPDEPGDVKWWHMVREGDGNIAMCGKEMASGARTMTDRRWGNTEEPSCHTCGAMYLREVPYRTVA
ncbi:hypothetical protein N0X72_12845 [Streptomyces carpaticus]|uniref:Uncharacterized protein n=1 Tax=Streptomyces harbinensis TaxID=1176198 RepID=A0A1I6TJC2_9ACTN|nr:MULTISPECIES: hypothetical protein [Streptomyces]UWM49828.1 hypothetical protein N0X72_12845 [Streptomyces carpaticus]SFS89228.1 hypothetical protein SAMN05444716_104696 [Streptomyces harbinensis]